jgi:predicted phosphodiesterase
LSTVLIIGDTHCPAMRPGYVPFLKSIERKYRPDRIVHIGDLVDWHAISYHEPNPDCRSAGDEYKITKRQVKELVKAFPKADLMIGNHDSLVHRKAASAGLPSAVIVPFAKQWDLPWKVHHRFSELLIDGVVYMHGEGRKGPGPVPAYNRAKVRFRSIVMGHWHSSAAAAWHPNREFRVFGLNVGTGVNYDALQMAYSKPIPEKPMLGCGVVIDGKRAVFEPWCLKSR